MILEEIHTQQALTKIFRISPLLSYLLMLIHKIFYFSFTFKKNTSFTKPDINRLCMYNSKVSKICRHLVQKGIFEFTFNKPKGKERNLLRKIKAQVQTCNILLISQRYVVRIRTITMSGVCENPLLSFPLTMTYKSNI